MQEYITRLYKKTKNDYPHVAEQYYPYGYTEVKTSLDSKSKDYYERDIHFAQPHQNEVLHCSYMDGARNGEFELYIDGENDSIVLMTGNFFDGRIEGFCEIFDEYKGKIFEGTWSDGERCGTCIEYEFGSVSFQGTYRNDKRNGYGWEYNDNELQREGIWRNGIYQASYDIVNHENFSPSGLGMTITDVDGDFNITTSLWEENKRNGKAFTYSLKQKRVTEERLYLHGDDIDTIIIPKPVSVSCGYILLPNGNTWHGEVVDGMANGEGEELTPTKVLLYKGQMFRNNRYGYGESYINGVLAYRGLWSMNNRMGDGVCYFPDGSIDCEGVWIEGLYADPHLTVNNNSLTVFSHVLLRQFIVGDDALNYVVDIDFSKYSLLEKFVVGKRSLQELSELNFRGLQCLREIEIGELSLTQCCFAMSHNGIEVDPSLKGRSMMDNDSRIKSEKKRIIITDCPILESVILERGACSDFYEFIVEELPMLRTLQLGVPSTELLEGQASYCFFYAQSLELRHLPSLETVIIGNRSFMCIEIFRMHDLPKLKSVHFGNRSCFGKQMRGDGAQLINISNMSMRELPQLESLKFEEIPNCNNVILLLKNFPRKAYPIEFGKNLSETILSTIKNS